METGLSGRVVLITGAGRNIGREMVLAFAREGAKLALCTRKNLQGLETTGGEAMALGAEVVTGRCDVADAQQVAEFVARVHEKFARIDVVVNNAVYRAEAEFLTQDLAQWQRNLAVNLDGPFHVCRNALPHMIEAGWGRVVNFSGIAPFVGHGVAKATAKLGIVGFTRGLAEEFAEHGITANCIGPGRIEVQRDAWQRDKSLMPDQPIRRLGQPHEVADLAVFLASEQAGYITGQCYLVNGGRYFL